MSKPTPNTETTEMVGLEPTAEMLEAGIGEFGWSDDAEDECRRIYIAMHAVALDAAEQRASSDVKLLEWKAGPNGYVGKAGRHVRIIRDDGWDRSEPYTYGLNASFVHLEDAKAYVQAEFEAEILSALQNGGGDA